VPILTQSSVEDRARLLELFPAADLRAVFQAKGTKAEICFGAATKNDEENTKKIASFVDNYFGCCKQHVYVFSHDEPVALPDGIADGEKVLQAGNRALYLSRVKYAVMLRNPPEETTLEFMWPVRIELSDKYLIVRFIVLEKNASSYFDRPTYVAGKSLTEKTVLAGIQTAALPSADLNKGVKKLWEENYLESTRSDFKKPFSTSSERMDEEKGIKEHYPELYAIMQEAPLYTTLFEVNDEHNTVETFSADPSHGIIGFTSYSEKGDTDAIIGKVISNN
jgi:hypothetical protein